MAAGDQQGEVGGALVEPEAAQDAFVFKALQEPEYGCLVTLPGQQGRLRELGEGHGALASEQGGQQFLQRLGTAQALGAAAGDDGVEFIGHGGKVEGGKWKVATSWQFLVLGCLRG